MPGQGGGRAFSILLDLPGAFLHKLKYRLARPWGPEFRVKGEEVPGHTVTVLPPSPPAAGLMSRSGVPRPRQGDVG